MMEVLMVFPIGSLPIAQYRPTCFSAPKAPINTNFKPPQTRTSEGTAEGGPRKQNSNSVLRKDESRRGCP